MHWSNGSQWNRSHWNWGNNWNSGSYSRRSIWDSVLFDLLMNEFNQVFRYECNAFMYIFKVNVMGFRNPRRGDFMNLIAIKQQATKLILIQIIELLIYLRNKNVMVS